MPSPEMIIALERRLTQTRGLFTCGTETKPNGEVCVVFTNAPRDLVAIFQNALSTDCSAVICSGEWGQFTKQIIFARAAKLRFFLQQEFRVRTGDRIAISLCNRPEFLFAFVAVTSLGATAVLVDQRNRDNELSCANEAGCKLIISETPALHEQRHNDEDRPVIISQISAGMPQNSRSLAEIVKGANIEVLPLVPVAPDVDGIIVFTSERGDHPKGAILSHHAIVTGVINSMLANVLATAGTTLPVSNLSPHPPTLLLSALSSFSGLSEFLQQALVGGRLVLRKFNAPTPVATLIQQENIGSIIGATEEVARELVEAVTHHNFGSLKKLDLGCTELSCKSVQDLRKAAPSAVISRSFGLEETAGVICSLAGESILDVPRTFGRVLPTVEIKITDAEHNRIADGQVGEIWVRGTMLFRDYLTPYTADFRDGWFNTGKKGILTTDRLLAIADSPKH